jgi:hypothetical protein
MGTVLTAVLAITLGSAQGGKLSVANDRLTYGHLGPARPNAKYLPGDVLHLAFELQHIKFDANGKASYAMGLEVLDGAGKDLYRQKPSNATALNHLGGDRLPCVANLQIPPVAPPGMYKFRVQVQDRATNQSVTIERMIEVLPAAFGLIQIGTSADREGHIAWSPVGVVGDAIHLNFSTIGFARDKKTKQPKVQVALRVLDDQGKPVNASKLTGTADSDIPESFAIIPMQFGITLNRPGRFTLELTATDHLTGQTARATFPLRVIAPD